MELKKKRTRRLPLLLFLLPAHLILEAIINLLLRIDSKVARDITFNGISVRGRCLVIVSKSQLEPIGQSKSDERLRKALLGRRLADPDIRITRFINDAVLVRRSHRKRKRIGIRLDKLRGF